MTDDTGRTLVDIVTVNELYLNLDGLVETIEYLKEKIDDINNDVQNPQYPFTNKEEVEAFEEKIVRLNEYIKSKTYELKMVTSYTTSNITYGLDKLRMEKEVRLMKGDQSVLK